MSDKFSKHRLICADYLQRHKSKIDCGRFVRKVSELSIGLLKRVLPAESAERVSTEDVLCMNCFKRFQSDIEELQREQKTPSSTSSSPSLPPADTSFKDEESLLQGVTETIDAAEVSVTPLKLPSNVSPTIRTTYVKRKQLEATEDFRKKIGRKLSDVYEAPIDVDQEEPCSSCEEWMSNLRVAYVRCTSQQERYRLLSLLPSHLSKKDILKSIPEATMHALDKSRKMKKEMGVWAAADPYEGHPLDEEDIGLALSYYTSDATDCTRQSPNKKDVVRVFSDGQEVFVTKRFLTRSIRETYGEFKAAHPESKIGLTKFYSLRPKWVKKRPVHEECVCVCCANFSLCLTSLSNATGRSVTFEAVQKLFLCENPSKDCFLLECKVCSNKKNVSLAMLGVELEDELELALWECGGELVKKHLGATAFLNEFEKWVKKYIPHNYIRCAQRKAIWLEKAHVKSRTVILHFDFAENWSVVIQRAVQGYHWKNKMVSIFTCVATTKLGTLSFGVVSDDICHDSAHAVFALNVIEDKLEELLPISSELVYVSDGAPSHFKNRHQMYEFKKKTVATKWIYTASGHGKSACDGVGGVLKHHASIYNLSTTESNSITNAQTFVEALSQKIKGIIILSICQEEITRFRKSKKKEWEKESPPKGIRSSHVWRKRKEEGSYTVILEKVCEAPQEPDIYHQ